MRRLGWFYLRGEDLPGGLPADLAAAALLEASGEGEGAAGGLARGVTDVVPSYDTVFVEYDTLLTDEAGVRRLLAGDPLGPPRERRPAEPRSVTIPTVYGGPHGPDLAEAAEVTGHSEERLVALHSGARYRVAAMGFMPGFAFMTGVPDELRLPRRPAPRPVVPAHSVAVANHQAGVYPLESPGGWNLLGRALVAMYDPHRPDPFLVRPGDTVRFQPAPRHARPPPSPRPLRLLPDDPAQPTLEVLAPGLLDLIVDAGRYMVGRHGLARCGPLDARTAGLANRLLGNPAGAPLVELTLTGPVLRAIRDAVVALTGDALTPLVDGQRLEPWSSFALRCGQVLSFEPGASGCRAYLALAGGVDSGTFMGSASVDLRGLVGGSLAAGDVIGGANERLGPAGRSFRPHASIRDVVTVRIVPGPQATHEALAALTSGTYAALRGDRTGIALDGPTVPGGEVTSEGTPIGAVQVTSAGSPIVLLHDRGTLGGYTKPAVVHPDDLAVVAQLRPNQRLRFVLTADGRTAASRRSPPVPRPAR